MAQQVTSHKSYAFDQIKHAEYTIPRTVSQQEKIGSFLTQFLLRNPSLSEILDLSPCCCAKKTCFLLTSLDFPEFSGHWFGNFLLTQFQIVPLFNTRPGQLSCRARVSSGFREESICSFNLEQKKVRHVERFSPMASKLQRSSGRQLTSYSEDEVCKQDYFIKSPPPQLFSSQGSWKRRYFILSKNGGNCYSLLYFKDHHFRGSIEIDQISRIEVGISNFEKMVSVQRMFKCQPDEVMSIKTLNRDYFLVGNNREKIEEWVSFISACLKQEAAHQNEQSHSLKREEQRKWTNFSLSLEPRGNVNIYQSLEDVQDVQEKHTSGDQRPTSDPGPSNTLDSKVHSNPPRWSLPDMELKDKHPHDPRQCQLLSDLAAECNQDKEEENVYLCPRSILAQLENDTVASDDSFKPIESSGLDQATQTSYDLYEPMKSCSGEEKHHQPSGNKTDFPTLPENEDKKKPLENRDPSSDTHISQSTKELKTRNKRKDSGSLSAVQLSIIINNIIDESQLEEVDICIPHADIRSYLTFSEAGGRLCVARWEGPQHLGCIFHHGDHVSAVNDLKPQTIEEISLFLSRSIRKEVKLSIHRIPNSDKFHIKACTCS
ncbi:pleckstrin homology domain-containing family S member 1 [Tachyglossus aculeatus]|uniref:pleckstrin homology domain-containing family S member 1 n=1 Tax=Tachyglossus aculeatus TaxID=9261 RepID=UPI0018F758F7|nr:pleckstrin homology domain-containing family S member 1 [Tachyglossus aculeatus]